MEQKLSPYTQAVFLCKYKLVIYLFSVDKMSHARFKMVLHNVLSAEVIS